VEEEQGALRDSDRVVSIHISLGHGLWVMKTPHLDFLRSRRPVVASYPARFFFGVRCEPVWVAGRGSRRAPRPALFKSALAIPRVVGGMVRSAPVTRCATRRVFLVCGRVWVAGHPVLRDVRKRTGDTTGVRREMRSVPVTRCVHSFGRKTRLGMSRLGLSQGGLVT
jgi:hypothetical protein